MKQPKYKTEAVSIMAQDAVQIASAWLWQHLPDRFSPTDPILDEQGNFWQVPVVLAYPGIVLGSVGEIFIDAHSGEIVSFTEIEQMKVQGLALGRRHRAKVRSAFLRARNA